MWQDSSERNGGADQSVEFFVAADRKLEVAGGNALDFEILSGVLGKHELVGIQADRWGVTHSCELENFGGEVFKDCGHVDGGFGSNAHLVLGVVLQETLDTAAGELEMKG